MKRVFVECPAHDSSCAGRMFRRLLFRLTRQRVARAASPWPCQTSPTPCTCRAAAFSSLDSAPKGTHARLHLRLFWANVRVVHCSRFGILHDLLEITWAGGGICVDDVNAATHLVVPPAEVAGADAASCGCAHPATMSGWAPTEPQRFCVVFGRASRGVEHPAGCKVVTSDWLRACRSAAHLVSTEPFATNSVSGGGAH